ncbi:Vacuolar protein sorting-associated protein 18 isoform 2 [Schistosoma japonicum]|uniref:Vacuolar protein sorting-associated protein 18 homolog n=1 Tax=Schistosoma japonicum TaxID=6182 RepID=A0A4Z2DIL9_SCHJA|nr:Vacuolar protein sorting-associated protein 18 isoform 2 [Schistosoma japonicum]
MIFTSIDLLFFTPQLFVPIYRCLHLENVKYWFLGHCISKRCSWCVRYAMQKGISDSDKHQSSAEFFSHDGIFSLGSAQWFRTVSSLTNLQVCNNYLVGASSKNTLIRASTIPPHNISEIEISRVSDDRVHNIFLDPMGWHTIISMQSGMNFYINKGIKKVRPLNKTKDHLFDSVAWNQHNVNELSTQEILIGTNDGLIFETVLMFNEDSFFSSGNIEQYWIQLMNLGHSVTGVEVIRFPIGSPNVLVGEPQRCVVFATTPCRMYQFAGWINTNNSTSGSILLHLGSNTASSGISSAINAYTGGYRSSLVNEYNQQSVGSQNTAIFPIITGLFYGVFNSDDKLPVGSKVTEFPGSFGYSDLKCYRNLKDELPTKFAWMTGPGIYFGYIRTEQLSMPPFTKHATNNDQPNDIKSLMNEVASFVPSTITTTTTDNSTDDPNQLKDIFSGRGVNLTRNTKLIPYPIIHMIERPGVPLGICMTEFHIIVIYVDRIKAVNTLDGRAVYSMPLNNVIGGERALGISRDSTSNRIWIFSNNHLAQLNIKNELCRIWQIYLNRLQFDEARQFCQDPYQLDTINIREAEYNFDNGNFIRSAKMFACSSLPFEQIALRFCRLSSSASVSMNLQSIPISSTFIQQGYEINDDHDIMEVLVEPIKYQIDQKITGNNSLTILQQCKQNLFTSHNNSNTLEPLKIFLSSKLDYLIEQKNHKNIHNKHSSQSVLNESGQIILLSLWLIELLLSELSVIRDRLNGITSEYSNDIDTENNSNSCINNMNNDVKLTLQNRLVSVQREFRTIITLPEVLNFLPRAKFLIYDLLESHGENDELVYFTELMKDYPRLFDHYMHQCMHNDALKVLALHPSNCLDRLYDYASCLASKCPKEFVDVCLRLNNKLDINRLLPSIMLLPHSQAISYLEDTIEKSANHIDSASSQAVHHMLISLYANEYRMHHQDKLMGYLNKFSTQVINMRRLKHQQDISDDVTDDYCQSFKFDLSELSLLEHNESIGRADNSAVDNVANTLTNQLSVEQNIHSLLPYDPGYVLRLCKEVGHLRGMIYILQLLDMHQEALQLAIEWSNIPLAKEIAQSDFLNSNLRRQLWIQLAQHIISTDNSMQEAINLLRECPLLKLEDILPYFHQFVTIDQFKDVICSSLDSYNERIENVKNEIQSTMRTIDELRTQSNNLRYRYEIIENDSRCIHCNHLLTLRAFYVFPCGHHFHITCLTELVKPYLTTEQKSQLSKVVESQSENNASVTSFEVSHILSVTFEKLFYRRFTIKS